MKKNLKITKTNYSNKDNYNNNGLNINYNLNNKYRPFTKEWEWVECCYHHIE